MVTYWWHTEVNDDLLCLAIISPSYPHHIPIISPSIPCLINIGFNCQTCWELMDIWWGYPSWETNRNCYRSPRWVRWLTDYFNGDVHSYVSLPKRKYVDHMEIQFKYDPHGRNEMENLHWISSGHARACFQQATFAVVCAVNCNLYDTMHALHHIAGIHSLAQSCKTRLEESRLFNLFKWHEATVVYMLVLTQKNIKLMNEFLQILHTSRDIMDG